MAKRESKESLFVRLTKLFRDTPIVRKKIRTTDTTVAIPDRSKSSGTLLFQKSISPTYASITANAYNIAERLARYQDFQEMELCVSGDTKVATSDGFVTMEELSERCKKDPEYKFIVYSYDHEKKKIVPALGKQARQTCVDDAYKVTFDNGQTITGNALHRLMLRDGSYCTIGDLKPGDSMMPFYRKDLFENAKEGTKGYSWIYTMDQRFRGWTKEHQLIAEFASGRELAEDEVVHHLNFIKTDNRPENLRIMNKLDHDSFHAQINNGIKWSPENSEWIEGFKKNHAVMMRDNNPVRRNDITFGLILQTCDQVGYDVYKLISVLGVSGSVIISRLQEKGFKSFSTFAEAYKRGHKPVEEMTTSPRLMTRDLSVELIKSVITEDDTHSTLCIKLGCSSNVFDKFLAKRLKIRWSELRVSLGFKSTGGSRPGKNKSPLTFQQLSEAYEKGISLPHLAVKLGVTKNTILSRLNQRGMTKYSEFTAQHENHKVVSIEHVGEMPLFDITVDGYKNFATDSVVSHNTAEICASLNVFADEAMSQDDKGRCLQIYSSNEKIAGHLHDLFYGSFNIDFQGRPLARNLCKFGDMFLLNDVSPQYGIENMYSIPVNEIEREENYDRECPFAHRFRWLTLGNRTLEPWEISHFRLLGNDMFLPYGTSVLDGARRIWRQLILSEDAMLVYRVVRAPERRVFYIDVGNIAEADIPGYIEETKRRMKSSQVIDQSTNRVDLRYNPMCISLNTIVKLQDGRNIPLSKIIEEWNAGKRDHYVYSIDHEGKQIAPGKIIWAGITRKQAKLVRVTLDDGTYRDTTPDHRWMLRDGSYKEAKDLAPGDSLMPLYVKKTSLEDGDRIIGYEKTYNPFTGVYCKTHRNNVIATKGFDALVGKIVHHVDFDKCNNNPDNLKPMTWKAHKDYHESVLHERNSSQQGRESSRNRMKKSWKDGNINPQHFVDMWADKSIRDKRVKKLTLDIGDKFADHMIRILSKIGNGKKTTMNEFLAGVNSDEQLKSYLCDLNPDFRNGFVDKTSANMLRVRLRKAGFENAFQSLKQTVYVNHKVVSVVELDWVEDTGDITVEKYHNFAVGQPHSFNTIALNKETESFVFIHNSIDEDFYLPRRSENSSTKIESLPGGTNTAAVEDVEYLQKKLFAAIQIPRAYLGYDESLSSKGTLAQLDIKFSRTINFIQKTIISEFNKAAIIHLYCNGFEGEDLTDFTLRIPNPSTIADQQKLELWRTKFDVASAVPEGLVTKGFIRREILHLNTEQCKLIDKEREYEKIIDSKVEAAASGGEGGGDTLGGGGGATDMDLGGGGDTSALEAPPDGSPADELGGGEETSATEETPPEENAGEDHEEEVDDSAQLLTSDSESRAERGSVPLKANNRVERERYNASRRRHHGPASTEMPDLTKSADISSSLKDPFALRESVSTDSIMDSFKRLDEMKDPHEHVFTNRLSKQMLTTLAEMDQTLSERRVASGGKSLNRSKKSGLISEGVDNGGDDDLLIDLEIGDESVYDK